MLATTPITSITTHTRPSSLRLPYGSYPTRQFFSDPTDPTDPAKPPVKTDPPGDPADLGDKGKAAIEAIRQEKRDAEKRARDAEKELADLKADQQKREDEDAERQGKWQELAEQRQRDLDAAKADADKRVADANAEIARRDRDDRARAALKAANLDDSLLDRLRGDTAEELKADADKLFKIVKAAAPKPTEGNGPNPSATGPAGDKADEAALKAHAAAFRV